MGIGNAPDTFGLTEYFITDVHTEVIGNEVRVICGVRRCGEIHWLYSAVMPADRLADVAMQCRDIALAAFNGAQLIETNVAH